MVMGAEWNRGGRTMKRVGDVLDGRDPFYVEVGATVADVVDYLCEKQIGAVAICEGEAVVGVFSERDLMRRVVKLGLLPAETPVAEVMTKDVFCVPLDETAHNARLLMFGKNFRHLAVVDDEGKFQGFVSMRELLEVDLEESQQLIRKLNDDFYQHQFEKPAAER